jgi:hypothetical protein
MEKVRNTLNCKRQAEQPDAKKHGQTANNDILQTTISRI